MAMFPTPILQGGLVAVPGIPTHVRVPLRHCVVLAMH